MADRRQRDSSLSRGRKSSSHHHRGKHESIKRSENLFSPSQNDSVRSSFAASSATSGAHQSSDSDTYSPRYSRRNASRSRRSHNQKSYPRKKSVDAFEDSDSHSDSQISKAKPNVFGKLRSLSRDISNRIKKKKDIEVNVSSDDQSVQSSQNSTRIRRKKHQIIRSPTQLKKSDFGLNNFRVVSKEEHAKYRDPQTFDSLNPTSFETADTHIAHDLSSRHSSRDSSLSEKSKKSYEKILKEKRKEQKREYFRLKRIQEQLDKSRLAQEIQKERLARENFILNFQLQQAAFQRGVPNQRSVDWRQYQNNNFTALSQSPKVKVQNDITGDFDTIHSTTKSDLDVSLHESATGKETDIDDENLDYDNIQSDLKLKVLKSIDKSHSSDNRIDFSSSDEEVAKKFALASKNLKVSTETPRKDTSKSAKSQGQVLQRKAEIASKSNINRSIETSKEKQEDSLSKVDQKIKSSHIKSQPSKKIHTKASEEEGERSSHTLREDTTYPEQLGKDSDDFGSDEKNSPTNNFAIPQLKNSSEQKFRENSDSDTNSDYSDSSGNDSYRPLAKSSQLALPYSQHLALVAPPQGYLNAVKAKSLGQAPKANLPYAKQNTIRQQNLLQKPTNLVRAPARNSSTIPYQPLSKQGVGNIIPPRRPQINYKSGLPGQIADKRDAIHLAKARANIPSNAYPKRQLQTIPKVPLKAALKVAAVRHQNKAASGLRVLRPVLASTKKSEAPEITTNEPEVATSPCYLLTEDALTRLIDIAVARRSEEQVSLSKNSNITDLSNKAKDLGSHQVFKNDSTQSHHRNLNREQTDPSFPSRIDSQRANAHPRFLSQGNFQNYRPISPRGPVDIPSQGVLRADQNSTQRAVQLPNNNTSEASTQSAAQAQGQRPFQTPSQGFPEAPGQSPTETPGQAPPQAPGQVPLQTLRQGLPQTHNQGHPQQAIQRPPEHSDPDTVSKQQLSESKHIEKRYESNSDSEYISTDECGSSSDLENTNTVQNPGNDQVTVTKVQGDPKAFRKHHTFDSKINNLTFDSTATQPYYDSVAPLSKFADIHQFENNYRTNRDEINNNKPKNSESLPTNFKEFNTENNSELSEFNFATSTENNFHFKKQFVDLDNKDVSEESDNDDSKNNMRSTRDPSVRIPKFSKNGNLFMEVSTDIDPFMSASDPDTPSEVKPEHVDIRCLPGLAADFNSTSVIQPGISMPNEDQKDSGANNSLLPNDLSLSFAETVPQKPEVETKIETKEKENADSGIPIQIQMALKEPPNPFGILGNQGVLPNIGGVVANPYVPAAINPYSSNMGGPFLNNGSNLFNTNAMGAFGSNTLSGLSTNANSLATSSDFPSNLANTTPLITANNMVNAPAPFITNTGSLSSQLSTGIGKSDASKEDDPFAVLEGVDVTVPSMESEQKNNGPILSAHDLFSAIKGGDIAVVDKATLRPTMGQPIWTPPPKEPNTFDLKKLDPLNPRSPVLPLFTPPPRNVPSQDKKIPDKGTAPDSMPFASNTNITPAVLPPTNEDKKSEGPIASTVSSTAKPTDQLNDPFASVTTLKAPTSLSSMKPQEQMPNMQGSAPIGQIAAFNSTFSPFNSQTPNNSQPPNNISSQFNFDSVNKPSNIVNNPSFQPTSQMFPSTMGAPIPPPGQLNSNNGSGFQSSFQNQMRPPLPPPTHMQAYQTNSAQQIPSESDYSDSDSESD